MTLIQLQRVLNCFPIRKTRLISCIACFKIVHQPINYSLQDIMGGCGGGTAHFLGPMGTKYVNPALWVHDHFQTGQG